MHADPAGDWAALFLALDGEAVLYGPSGDRHVAARDFFTGMLRSATAPGEVLTEVRLSVARKRGGVAYEKLRQPASGFAIVGVAASVEIDRKGRCERASIGVTGVNPVPFLAAGVASRLHGCELDSASLASACAEVEEADPLEDLHASAEYRRRLVSVFARRALARAAARAAA